MSSIVLMEMRQCVFSYGGKSRATRMPCFAQNSRKPLAGRLRLTNRKFVCESVGV
jgi:hypothetical protein